MMTNASLPRTWSLLLLAALPLAAARCGGSSDDDSSAGKSGTGGKGGNAGKPAAGSSGKGTSSGKGGGGTTGGAAGSSGSGTRGGTGGSGVGGGDAGSGAGRAQHGAAGQAGEPSSGGAAGASGGNDAGGEGGVTAGAGGQSASICMHDPGTTCGGDLSNIGTGDFEIDLELTTTADAVSAVLSQRGVCDHSYFWDVRMIAAGSLLFELDDANQHYARCNGTRLVNDGQPHWVVIRRVAQELSIYVDCELDQACAATTDVTETLAPVATGTSSCVGASGDGTVALDGSVSSVCIGQP